jgi:hypothetical protein
MNGATHRSEDYIRVWLDQVLLLGQNYFLMQLFDHSIWNGTRNGLIFA